MIKVKNLDFVKIITIDLWLLKNDKSKNLKISFLIIFFLKILYRSILFIPKIKIQKEFEIFYIRTFSRPDLKQHSNYYENFRGTSVCILSERKKKINIFILLKIFFFLILNFKFWYLGLKKCNLKFFSKNSFYIFLVFLESLSNVLKIIPFLKKHKKLVCFQETLPTENFLCQYANTLNIKTYSIQHAIGIYKTKGSFDYKFPICNYMNLVSKNILCWGNHNKTIFKKHTTSKIHIIGKSYLPNLSTKISGVTFIFENKEFKKINNYMLRLSDKFQKNKIQISRWYKPSHSLSSSGIIRDGPLRNIIIGSNSSLLVELGYLGFKVFITKYSNLKNYLPKNLVVDEDNFLKKKQIISKNYPHKIWNTFIECSNNESLRRYKKILK
jgi:hypothetical protein